MLRFCSPLLRAFPLAILLLAGGCGDSTPAGDLPADVLPDTVPADVADVVGQDNGQIDTVVRDEIGDTQLPDTQTDVIYDTQMDVPADTADAVEDVIVECPGNYMCPCDSAEDCLSGLCVQTPDGSVCSRMCGDGADCPDGFTCTIVSQSGTDAIYGCVSKFPDLCKPCRNDQDCVPNVGAGNRIYKCIYHDENGSYCGAECVEDRECPESYICEDFLDGETEYTQCVPENGECACTTRYATAGYLTDCTNTNGFGTCDGTRPCDNECDAGTAAVEICNHFDDNCDDMIDNGVPPEDCPLINVIGTCTGSTVCINGENICQGTYAAYEVCNGFDDDCDGEDDDGLGQTTCGLGECVHTVLNCENDELQDCDPLEGAYDELCDGIDNDCDGTRDNGFIDTDQDTTRDCVDTDDDADTLDDTEDNCSLVPNLNQANLDGDEFGDVCDADRDGDDFLNDADNCPGLYNPEQTDLNDNGIGDDCECDTDNDGIENDCPGVVGTDNCPWAVNILQADQDIDGVGDACDCDIDDDGVGNGGFDYDKVACPIPVPVDNCAMVYNPLQENLDSDAYGDACDCDIDDDGDLNAAYGCANADSDCAPMDPDVRHGAAEICNDINDDCDGATDEACDDDNDDFCDAGIEIVGTPAVCPNGGDDCNDTKSAIRPDAVEICNNVDDDCVGGVDNGLGSTTCGLGQCVHTVANCISGETQTCNAMQGSTPEICDDIDNDCDGSTDEACDDDGDDYCDSGISISGTPAVCPNGGSDCNDGNIAIHPGAVEVCNGADDNCGGNTDENLGSTTCGVGVCRHTISNCVNGTTQICDAMEGAVDEACDGLDNDCDTGTDEGCDDDADDFCDSNMAMYGTPSVCPYGGGDCDDSKSAIKPTAIEKCDDIDNNCDSDTDVGCDDDGDGYCDTGMTVIGTPTSCPNGAGDCFDLVFARNPGATETCNGIDDNCNGSFDEGLGTVTCGLGICNHTIQKCVSGETQTCDPMLGAVTETCDGLNNDCDADTDEGCDDDGDDYCDSTMGTTGSPSVCPNGGGDCNDDSAAVRPSATEGCNDINDDCDSATDEGCDDDSDDYCDSAMTTTGAPTICPNGGNDCNDTTSAVRPGATETCNNVDDDCSGVTDDNVAAAIDTFEPNETCSDPETLADIVENAGAASYTGKIYASGDKDFYKVFTEEESNACIPWTTEKFRLTIDLTPPSGADCVDLDVVLYDDGCAQLAATSATGCSAEQLVYEWNGQCTANDDETFRFAVQGKSASDWECMGYTISIKREQL